MSISKLFVDRQVADSPVTIAIRKRIHVHAQIVPGVQQVFDYVSSADDPVQKGKEVLFLTRNKGAFIKKCPGTRAYTCCDYQILNVGTFCTMDCAYCILQTYFHPPVLQFYVNHEDMLTELNQLIAKGNICRIGTGEFTDSLIWEIWFDLSKVLIPVLASQNSVVLELKTKTTAIEGLRGLTHNRKIIIAWSLNTPEVIAEQERHTATLDARLKAAAKCVSWGYPLAFHFDPILIYDGCEEHYLRVVEKIFTIIDSNHIVWISLGSFRFVSALKPVIAKRFPDSKIIYGEFIMGLDGKMRYFKPLRIHVYQQIVSCIRKLAPDVLIYFCMEDDEVWQKSLGFIPATRGGLPRMLDESAVKHCGLNPDG